MTGKSEIRTEVKERFQPMDFKNTIASNHGIFERDRWMVQQCDILYLDLTGTERVSIGCMMELAWAAILGKYAVVVMNKENIHRHAFVVEAADIIFENADIALAYLAKLAGQTI
jgi:nucleoside 2-deoxyribosyltransferase